MLMVGWQATGAYHVLFDSSFETDLKVSRFLCSGCFGGGIFVPSSVEPLVPGRTAVDFWMAFIEEC
jgi:hypothetical protein